MNNLKQKWTEALPVFASVFFLIGIMFLIIWGIVQFANWVSKPDTRTVEEIKTERYKECIKYTRGPADAIRSCEVYLELKSN